MTTLNDIIHELYAIDRMLFASGYDKTHDVIRRLHKTLDDLNDFAKKTPEAPQSCGNTDWEAEAKEAWRKIEIYKEEADRYKHEYDHAVNEIGQLQEQLKDAEEEIRQLSQFDER